MNRADEIKQKALELGFDVVGITDAGAIEVEQVRMLREWLQGGYAGQMEYMHRHFEKRINPAALFAGAQSVICVGLNYKPPRSKRRSERPGRTGRIANYARYEDYHRFMKSRLHELAEFVGSLVGGEWRFKICVDSAPAAERALAARAGLGFIGKNHMLIHPDFGPEILLGEIVTDLELQADEPFAVNCENCNKCIEACPTGALRADGFFDAGRCISYLTIEHKGEIGRGAAEQMGERLFGCDECVAACPYAEKAPVCGNKQFRFYGGRERLDLGEVLRMSRESFEAEFADSAVRRAGLERLKRNAGICLQNVRAGL